MIYHPLPLFNCIHKTNHNQTTCSCCPKASSTDASLPRNHKMILFLNAMTAKNSKPPTDGRSVRRGAGVGGVWLTGKHYLPGQHVMRVLGSERLGVQDTAPPRHVLLHLYGCMLMLQSRLCSCFRVRHGLRHSRASSNIDSRWRRRRWLFGRWNSSRLGFGCCGGQ